MQIKKEQTKPDHCEHPHGFSTKISSINSNPGACYRKTKPEIIQPMIRKLPPSLLNYESRK